MKETELKFRENVAGILRDDRGRILICERLGVRDAWQFPQGGIDAGETPEEALVRELWEEISVAALDFRIVERHGPYRYVFGEGRVKKGRAATNLSPFIPRLSPLVSRFSTSGWLDSKPTMRN